MTVQSLPVKSYSQPAAQFAASRPEVFIFPSDPGYHAARFAWNAAVDQRPAVVVMAERAQDVVEAVQYARQHDLPVAVQGTGHGVIRKADGAVLINTAKMQGVRVDPERQTAWVEAGVQWGEC